MPVALALDGVSFAYRPGQPVLDAVGLVVEEGEFVAIAGPNGGGKTTLVRLALGLARPQTGTVRLFGEPAHRFSRRSTLGYVAQRTRVGTQGPVTVHELVAAGRLAQGGLLGPLRRRDRAIVDEAIADVGLSDLAGAPLASLSGGQQQRAFIAKALAGEPSLLVLDEPTAGVDAGSQEALARLLGRLHEARPTTTLYVSHEFGAVEEIVERLVLVRGGIVFDGPPRDLPGEWHDPSHTHARV
ncbi:MAG TPA: ABC transporter ATP-binding protein [Gaiellaceae bacterium]|nr:ABC transporter ATP-binding protein [Gaiellaceae bacterium]